MLRIAEQWHGSDLGLQRQGNEDNYFVRAPLFVVADGMGGAQAGEVASEMAVESFGAGLPDGAPAEGLVQIIEGANRRIHERSRTEHQRAGMGTTVTAAYVGDDAVTVAHVGDSRAYLLRDGDLIRLTRDHSLGGELVERGKLTEEQAESHPQRSVITRALGPEPNVQVDVSDYPAHAGDLFLLCSDGLTAMVHENGLKPLLLDARPLEELGRDLIAAANAAGGRDNITVVLFRLEEVEPAAGSVAAASGAVSRGEDTAEYDTFTGDALTQPRQGRPPPGAAAGRLPPGGPHAPARRGGARPVARAGGRRRGGRVPALGHRRAAGGAPAPAAGRRGGPPATAPPGRAGPAPAAARHAGPRPRPRRRRGRARRAVARHAR